MRGVRLVVWQTGKIIWRQPPNRSLQPRRQWIEGAAGSAGNLGVEMKAIVQISDTLMNSVEQGLAHQ